MRIELQKARQKKKYTHEQVAKKPEYTGNIYAYRARDKEPIFGISLENS